MEWLTPFGVELRLAVEDSRPKENMYRLELQNIKMILQYYPLISTGTIYI